MRLPGLLGLFNGIGRLFVDAAYWIFTTVLLVIAISPWFVNPGRLWLDG
jgi:hypothetical protein